VLAIYPGSFDPITFGHLDIIERGCKLFDRVVVAVATNPNKTPLFPVSKRIEQIRSCTKHLDNLDIDSLDGLTVDYAGMRQAQVLLRGLRVLSDFEMELQMAHLNKTLSSQIETVFLATNNEYSFLSSSAVKEIAKFGGSVDRFVPPSVALDIYKCYARTQPESNPNPTEPPLKTNPPPMEFP
jgi:pantetheine-phosphate adenylyltransferase